jgi:hypothetical protein
MIPKVGWRAIRPMGVPLLGVGWVQWQELQDLDAPKNLAKMLEL